MSKELKRRGYWARKNKVKSQLWETRLEAYVIKREQQLVREMESTKFFMEIIDELKTSIYNLMNEISYKNKQHENLLKLFKGTITNLKNEVKCGNENPVHEAQQLSKFPDVHENPVHEKQNHPFHKPKKKKRRKVRKI